MDRFAGTFAVYGFLMLGFSFWRQLNGEDLHALIDLAVAGAGFGLSLLATIAERLRVR